MMKKFFALILLCTLSFMLVACSGLGGNVNTMASTCGIYDLYYLNMLTVQGQVPESVERSNLDSSDKALVDSVVNNFGLLKEDEFAIVASVECFNLVGSPKEVAVIREGTDRIFVKQQNGKFNCQMEYNGEVTKEYVFEIDKKDGTYSIKYTKDSQNCTASVVFDASKSNIQITISSVENGGKVEVRKQFYALKNNNYAFRLNWSKGNASNRSIYGVDYFREVFNFNAKISSLQAFDAVITPSELSFDGLSASLANANCGFKLRSKNNDIEVMRFGDFMSW